MGASRESLGFASLQEKRIAQRYNRKKRRSIEISGSVEEGGKDNSTTPTPKSKRFQSNVINVDYEKIKEERQVQLEELQTSSMSEKDVKKRMKKRQKVTRRLSQRTKRGQPLMSNHLQYLLSKIQSVTSVK